MAIYGQCQQCRHFDGNTCALFTAAYDGRGCESFDPSPSTAMTNTDYGDAYPPGSPEVIFDDSYKPTPSREPMSGWLKLFLILFVGIFGLVSLCLAVLILLSHPGDDGAWWDIGIYAVAAAVAVYTIAGFVRRSPDAVFLAKLYVGIRLCISGIMLLGSYSPDCPAYGIGYVLWIAVWCAWLAYLRRSEHVRRLIPASYRKLGAADWILLVAAIASFAAPIVSGIIDVMRAPSEQSRNIATDGSFEYTIPDDCYEWPDSLIYLKEYAEKYVEEYRSL